MKILLHITPNNEYIIGEDKTGKVTKYNRQALIMGHSAQKSGVKYMIIKDNYVGVDKRFEQKFKSNAVAVLASLAENKKIFGYMLYIPVENTLRCVSGDMAAELASQYGIVYGKIKNTPSNKKRYIEGNFSMQQGYYHKQVYMELYKERKSEAERLGRASEKIVRPETNVIELRYLPPFVFDTYKEPRGVNSFNFKWFRLIENQLNVLKRPQVNNLDISTYGERIRYTGVGEEYEKKLLEGNTSLGAFAHWHISNLLLGSMLKEIGREAFYDNNLVEVKIPKSVSSIGKAAFMNNILKRVYFCKGVDLDLGDFAFANNDLQEICIPYNIVSIGEHCFSGNLDLQSVRFDEDSKIAELKDGVFEDCAFESIKLPLSIKKVSKGAFRGCDNLTKVIILKESELNTKEFKEQLGRTGVELVVE